MFFLADTSEDLTKMYFFGGNIIISPRPGDSWQLPARCSSAELVNRSLAYFFDLKNVFDEEYDSIVDEYIRTYNYAMPDWDVIFTYS